MRLTLTRDMSALRANATLRVNEAAESARAPYITKGDGQTMTYMEKAQQAEMVSANPGISPALVPLVAIDAARYGDSLLDAAAVILTMKQMWSVIGTAIEDKRLAAQDAITSATSPAEIEAATNVDWTVQI